MVRNGLKIRTRHEWQQWERCSFLAKATGRVELVEGWVCTKCGRRKASRTVRETKL